MSEKPLHVRVAEAVGWTDIALVDGSPFEPQWMGMPPKDWDTDLAITVIDHDKRSVTFGRGPATVSRYDTDWAASGPLIEKHGVTVAVERREILPNGDVKLLWSADTWDETGLVAYGPTPLVAACNFFLLLRQRERL